jgi:hypothetical protein
MITIPCRLPAGGKSWNRKGGCSMPIIPPLGHPGRSGYCQETLGANIRAVADQAVAMGWDKEEITAAIMEIANAWYFDQVAGENMEAPGDTCEGAAPPLALW